MLRIDHETRLSYSEAVIESVIEVRMTPPSNEDQTILGHKIRISPSAALTIFRDGFGNQAQLFSVVPPHSEVLIQAATCVRVHRRDPRKILSGAPWPIDQNLSVEAVEFLRPSPLTEPCDSLRAFAAELPKLPGTLLDAVQLLLDTVRARLNYTKQVTDASTPVSKALELGQGVCQDFSHLFIAASRQLGLPARYVSGYVNEPGEIATHAWCQIWAGAGVGWVDVDPTRKIFCGNDHILTAVGRDFSDVPPNKGVWKGAGAKETISVLVNVQKIDRVPTELTELASPAWTSTSAEQVGTNNRAFFHQQRRIIYRQQQSQQQQ
ncbi:transglutaminase family protein [Telmatocola sphagniphila]|uniref:Transglutaminase family protein n=1 Tax=Telmatocola sphagniphila TaxID=1123043 RepID=A0A8E6B2K1_9BACT|nr:transglutaminase family protein [Telmatocola sphagniphila]QVL30945.1 transglutaminase family protein [Telmatocola sphagniphila]